MGCARCKALFDTVQRVVKEVGLDATVSKEEDILKIVEYGVMTLPAIVVDGSVVAKGALSLKETKELITKLSKV